MIEAQTQNVAQEATETSAEKVLSVSQILNDLDNGLGRPEIAKKYGLKPGEVKVMFEHPSLKGRRPKRATTKVTFTLVDDVTPQQNLNQLFNPNKESDFDVDADESEQTILQVKDNVSENANDESFNHFEIQD
jgi:hypothetical protein